MTAPAASPKLLRVLDGLKVIDSDTHITEAADLWTSRAPASFRDRVPYIQNIDGKDLWCLNGEVFAINIGGNVVRQDGQKKYGTFYVDTFDQVDRAATYPKDRIELMDRLGIWAQIAYPNAIGFSSNKFMRIEDPEVRNLCISIYNDAMGEFQKDTNNRVFPQALLPFWDLPAALKEMRRSKEELGMTGFCITDRPDTFDLPDFGDAHWDPFWELANELEMPINFHVGSGAKNPRMDRLGSMKEMVWSTYPLQKRQAIHATQLYVSNVRILCNLLMSDLFDRYPKLKVVSVESGIGWIPFVLEALEYQLDEMVTENNQQRRPKEYFRDHIYACFWFETFGPRYMLEEVGVNNILFETDFPHPTCLYPRSQEHVANVLSDIAPAIRRRVLQDNAIELYKLPVETTP